MFNNKKEAKEAKRISQSTNIIGQGSSIEGNIQSEDSMRLEGTVQGNITTRSKLVLGRTGYLKGNFVAQNAEISGKVEGKVEVSETLILRATAVIIGDIFTKQLVIEAGACFDGTCEMSEHNKNLSFHETTQKEEEKSLSLL